MNDPDNNYPHDRERGKSWRDQFPLLIAGGVISIAVAGAVAFSGRVMTGGETAAVLTTQVQALIDDIKESRSEDKDQRRLLQDMNQKIGDLYTRREAQADREAAERRFQSVESRIGDLGHRIDVLETSLRFIPQPSDKSGRRP